MPSNEAIDKYMQEFSEAMSTKADGIRDAEEAIEKGDGLKAAKKLLEVIGAQDKLLSMLTHDLVTMSKQMRAMQADVFMAEMKQACAISTLIEKNLITEEEFQTVWKRDVLPQLEEAGLVKKQSQIIQPKKQLIIP